MLFRNLIIKLARVVWFRGDVCIRTTSKSPFELLPMYPLPRIDCQVEDEDEVHLRYIDNATGIDVTKLSIPPGTVMDLSAPRRFSIPE